MKVIKYVNLIGLPLIGFVALVNHFYRPSQSCAAHPVNLAVHLLAWSLLILPLVAFCGWITYRHFKKTVAAALVTLITLSAPQPAPAQLVQVVSICLVVTIGTYTYVFYKVKSISRLQKIDISCNCAPQFVNTPIQDSLFKSNGCANATFTLSGGRLPPGVTLKESGLIAGKPTATGTFCFTATVTDQCLNETNGTFAITILPNTLAGPAAVSPLCIQMPPLDCGQLGASGFSQWQLQTSSDLSNWTTRGWTIQLWSDDNSSYAQIVDATGQVVSSGSCDGMGSYPINLAAPDYLAPADRMFSRTVE